VINMMVLTIISGITQEGRRRRNFEMMPVSGLSMSHWTDTSCGKDGGSGVGSWSGGPDASILSIVGEIHIMEDVRWKSLVTWHVVQTGAIMRSYPGTHSHSMEEECTPFPFTLPWNSPVS
jgi:hypothetical protein